MAKAGKKPEAAVPAPRRTPSAVVLDTLVDAVSRGLDYLEQADPETAESYGKIRVADLFGHIVAPYLLARSPVFRELPASALKAMRAKNLAQESILLNRQERAPAIRRFARSMFRTLDYEGDPVVKAVVRGGAEQPAKVDIGPDGLKKALEIIISGREVDDDVYKYMVNVAGGPAGKEVPTVVRGRVMTTSKIIPREIVGGVTRGAVQAITERVPVPKGEGFIEGGRAIGELSLSEIAREAAERVSGGESRESVIRDVIGRFAIQRQGEVVLPYRGLIAALFSPPKGKMRTMVAMDEAVEAAGGTVDIWEEVRGKPYSKLIDELNLEGLALLATAPDISIWDHARRIRTASTISPQHLAGRLPPEEVPEDVLRELRQGKLAVKTLPARRPNFPAVVSAYTKGEVKADDYTKKIENVVVDAISKKPPAEAADQALRDIEDFLREERIAVPEGWSSLVASAVHEVARNVKRGKGSLNKAVTQIESMLWRNGNTVYLPLLNKVGIKMEDLLGMTVKGYKARSAPVAYRAEEGLRGFTHEDLEEFADSVGKRFRAVLEKHKVGPKGITTPGMDAFLGSLSREYGPMISQSTLVRLATPSFVKLNMPRPDVLDFAFSSKGADVLGLPTVATGELDDQRSREVANRLVEAASKGLSRNVPKPLVHALIGMAKHVIAHGEAAVADRELIQRFSRAAKGAGIEESVQSFTAPGEIYGQKLADAFLGRFGKGESPLLGGSYAGGITSVPPVVATPDRLGFALSVAEPASKLIEAARRGKRGLEYMLAASSRGEGMEISERELERSTRTLGEKVMLRYMAQDLVAITDPGLVALWSAVRDQVGGSAVANFVFGKAGLPSITIVKGFLDRHARSAGERAGSAPLSPLYFASQLGG